MKNTILIFFLTFNLISCAKPTKNESLTNQSEIIKSNETQGNNEISIKYSTPMHVATATAVTATALTPKKYTDARNDGISAITTPHITVLTVYVPFSCGESEITYLLIFYSFPI